MVHGELRHTIPTIASPLVTHNEEICLSVGGVVKGIYIAEANYLLILSLYNKEDVGSPHAMLGWFEFMEGNTFSVSFSLPAGTYRVLFSVQWMYSCSMELKNITASNGPCDHDG